MKLIRYTMSLLLISAMVFAAMFTNTKEVIFPEIAALAIGAWIADKQPWEVNKRRIVSLMTLCAVIGLCIAKYVSLPLIFKLALGFCIVYSILGIAKTNFAPLISAALLPILLDTQTWIYPLSVLIFSLLIILGQWVMEKFGIRDKNVFVPYDVCAKDAAFKAMKLLLILMLFALLPIHYEKLFIIAPPLIVIFTEFSREDNPLRACPMKIINLTGFAALAQCSMILILHNIFSVPLIAGTVFCAILLFAAFKKAKVKFAPIGAILLLPLLLNNDELMLYPLEVYLGCAMFVAAAMLTFKNSETISRVK